MATIDELVIEMRADTSDLRRSMRRVEGQIQGSTRNMERSFGGVSGAVRNLQQAIIAVGAVRAVRGLTNVALEFEGLQNSMVAATGSAEAAAEALDFVSQEANRIGIDAVEASRNFVSLTAAAKGTSLEGQATRDIFISVAEASRVMGLSAEQTGGALTAIQQMISKGTVSAEELRGQLGERLPGAFQIAARSMGVTTQELGKMLERGELTAEELLPKLAAALRESVAEGVPDATQSAGAAFARLRNAINETVREADLTPLQDSVEDLTEVLRDPRVFEAIQGIASALLRLTGAAASAAAKFAGLGTAIGEGLAKITVGKTAEDELADLQERLELYQRTLERTPEDAGGFVTMQQKIEETQQAIDELTSAYPALYSRATEETQKLSEEQERLNQLFDEAVAQQEENERAYTDSQEAQAEAARKRAEEEQKAAEKIRKAIDETIKELELEAATFNMTETEAKLFELAQRGASGPQLEDAEDALAQIDRQRTLNAEFERAEEQFERLEEAERRRKEQLDESAERIKDQLDPTRELQREMELLATLFETRRLSPEQYTQALNDVKDRMQELSDETDESTKFIEDAWEQAAKNIQSSLADFLFDPFDQSLEGMLDGLERTLRRMAAEAASARIIEGLQGQVSDLFSEGGGGNVLSNVLSGLGSFFGGFFEGGGRPPVGVPSVVGERGPELFVPDRPGTVVTAGDMTRNVSVTNVINVSTPDGNLSRPTLTQLQASVAQATQRAARRNN